MRAFIFTSDLLRILPIRRAIATMVGLFIVLLVLVSTGSANDGFGTGSTPGRTEEDDYSTTPYMEYGEFNEDDEEAEITQYLQYGRFFGVSLGVGTHGATGNRGQLWDGGFPLMDLKLHYWFNFNFALQMGFMTAPHSFQQGVNTTQVTMSRVGADLKFYFDTRDLSSAVTFAGPYIFLGAGNFTKSQTSSGTQASDHDSSVGLSLGAGLEFTVSPRRIFFFLQGQLDMVTFKDTNTTEFQDTNGLANLNGQFYSLVGGFLFAW